MSLLRWKSCARGARKFLKRSDAMKAINPFEATVLDEGEDEPDMDYASALRASRAAGAAAGLRRAPRSSLPCSEFDRNGLNLMVMFRTVFPLMWHSDTESGPWSNRGTISTAQTRHLFLQFTNVASRTPALAFVLANQTQRHHRPSAPSRKDRSRCQHQKRGAEHRGDRRST